MFKARLGQATDGIQKAPAHLFSTERHDQRMQGDEALVRMLAELVMDLAWFLESGDDSVVDPDDAVKQLEWISYRLGALSAGDRVRLIALIRERAEAESDPAFRKFLEASPEALGLVDEDD